ncbi:hypothetical protein [Polaromonas sp. YR568]|uniref:hypothetical protein n=1 Tax=Polaromonas sp. YR568 TaxID=1855301 RepID=UPI0031381167
MSALAWFLSCEAWRVGVAQWMPDGIHQTQGLACRVRPEINDGLMAKRMGTAPCGVVNALVFEKLVLPVHGLSFHWCIQRLLVNITVGSALHRRNRMARNWVLLRLQNSACREHRLPLPSPHARPEL